jgi:hypothetical protein
MRQEESGTRKTLAEVHKTALSLRFSGDNLDPDEITDGLGVRPTSAARKGGIHLTPKGKEIISRTGLWLLTVEQSSPGDLEKKITALLSPLTDNLDIWRHFATRYSGNIFAGLFIAAPNEGLSLGPQTLSALVSRGLVLGLDIYKYKDLE